MSTAAIIVLHLDMDFKRAEAIYKAPKRWICGTSIPGFIQSMFFQLNEGIHLPKSFDVPAKWLDAVLLA